jgi:hypothetical protein
MKYLLPGLCLVAALALLAQTQQPAPAPKDDAKTPAKAAGKADAKADAKAAAPAEKKAPAPPAEPKERTVYRYVYDLNGRPEANPGEASQRSGGGGTQQQTLRGADGRPVVAVETQERSLGPTTSERVVQHYDPTGKPTTKEVVRTERRPQPDGSTVTTETTYLQDLSGHLDLNERRTTSEKKTSTGAVAATVVERPSINGGIRVVQRDDRVETKRGENVTEAVTSRRYADPAGRLTEQERERSVATKAGDATSIETEKWRLGVAGVSGQMDLTTRSVSRMTERPDGSQVEDTKVYSSLIGGTTPDLNRGAAGQLTLEEESHREKKVQAGGKTVETRSSRLRTVAEPSRLNGLVTEEHVTTPTPDGKTIQTTISERDSNGRIVPVRRETEQVKN